MLKTLHDKNQFLGGDNGRFHSPSHLNSFFFFGLNAMVINISQNTFLQSENVSVWKNRRCRQQSWTRIQRGNGRKHTLLHSLVKTLILCPLSQSSLHICIIMRLTSRSRSSVCEQTGEAVAGCEKVQQQEERIRAG